MWNPDFKTPFIDRYCADHGAETLLANFFDPEGNPTQNAPRELLLEVAAIRGEIDFSESREYRAHVRLWVS